MIGNFVKYGKLSILAGTLLLTSCMDDDLVKRRGQDEVVSDIPVTLSLKVQVASSKVSTRAQSDEQERLVENIYVMAFKPIDTTIDEADLTDEQWVLDNGKNFVIGQSITTSITLEDKNYEGFPMSTGRRKIYAIGNPSSGSGLLELSDFTKITTLKELKELASPLRDYRSIERSDFKMVGQVLANDGSEVVTVDERSGQGGYIREEYSLQLKRVDARISFVIKGTGGYTFTPEYYQVMNIPGGTYVLPREKGDIEKDPNTWDYQGSGYGKIGYRTLTFTTTENGDPLFEFYLCESRLKYKTKITTDEVEANKDKGATTLYSLREKQEKKQLDGGKVENGGFVYAPENSTYIILGGTVTGTRAVDGSSQEVYAKVTYKIHLGNTGTKDDANNETKANNYDIERNTHYTYNVTVAGVEKIIVEVEEEREEEPGATGDVILTRGTVVSLDSHYSRFLMTLKKNDILSGLSWSISTPFQRGLKVFNAYKTSGTKGTMGMAYLPDGSTEEQEFGLSNNELSLNDYKWVKFAVNIECRAVRGGVMSSSNVIKFPGEQAYDGGSNNDTPAPIAGGEYSQTDYYTQVRLYDINQLLNFLYNEAVKDGDTNASAIFEGNGSDRSVTMTCFIDENYYIYDPAKFYYHRPIRIGDGSGGDDGDDGIVDLTLWKQTVNTENRLLNICVDGSKYSADGESSVSQSVYTISQNPIYTFYNPKYENSVNTAWGVEAKLETKFLPIRPSTVNQQTFNERFASFTNTMDNGRTNMLNILGKSTLYWDNVLNTDISDIDNILMSNYRSIWYACLTRNRDLNGNNIVDASEIRWYLASIDQLTDMWIGEDAIPNAKLYQAEVNNDWSVGDLTEGTTRVHVASSSYYNGGAGGNNGSDNLPSNPWVIWSEEGASRGSANASSSSTGEVHISSFSYRCVRNLGLSSADREVVPADYVEKGKSSYTNSEGRTYQEVTIDISNMMDDCIRPPMGSENSVLPTHTERDASRNNRPPLTLAILYDESNTEDDQLYPTDSSISWTQGQNERTSRPCPMGYRIPNQRELMLIYTTYSDLALKRNLLSKTKFSYQNTVIGDNGDKVGFVYNDNNLRLISNATESVYKVRCVRDATNNPGGSN